LPIRLNNYASDADLFVFRKTTKVNVVIRNKEDILHLKIKVGDRQLLYDSAAFWTQMTFYVAQLTP